MNITIIDGLSFKSLVENTKNVKVNYQNLKMALEIIRNKNNFLPSDRYDLFTSINPRNDGEKLFIKYLSKIEINPIVFREKNSSISPPLFWDLNRSFNSMVNKIAYTLGLLSKYPKANILVVSHCFELCEIIEDLERKIPGSVLGICFFHSYLRENHRS